MPIAVMRPAPFERSWSATAMAENPSQHSRYPARKAAAVRLRRRPCVEQDDRRRSGDHHRDHHHPPHRQDQRDALGVPGHRHRHARCRRRARIHRPRRSSRQAARAGRAIVMPRWRRRMSSAAPLIGAHDPVAVEMEIGELAVAAASSIGTGPSTSRAPSRSRRVHIRSRRAGRSGRGLRGRRPGS